MFRRNEDGPYDCKHAEGLEEGEWNGAKERCGINWGRHGATFCGGIVARRFSDGTPITPASKFCPQTIRSTMVPCSGGSSTFSRKGDQERRTRQPSLKLRTVAIAIARAAIDATRKIASASCAR